MSEGIFTLPSQLGQDKFTNQPPCLTDYFCPITEFAL